MEKLKVSFDEYVWNYTIDFTHDTVYEQEQTAAEVIADIAGHPYNPIDFSYHCDGTHGGKDTDHEETLSGRDAINYILEFFNDETAPEVMRLAAEETATYDAENWLKGTPYYPPEEPEEDEEE